MSGCCCVRECVSSTCWWTYHGALTMRNSLSYHFFTPAARTIQTKLINNFLIFLSLFIVRCAESENEPEKWKKWNTTKILPIAYTNSHFARSLKNQKRARNSPNGCCVLVCVCVCELRKSPIFAHCINNNKQYFILIRMLHEPSDVLCEANEWVCINNTAMLKRAIAVRTKNIAKYVRETVYGLWYTR